MIYLLLQNVGLAKLFESTRMVMSCLQTVSPYKYQQVNVHYHVRVPSSKACLSGEGVAVDKIRKCGRYIAYTALVALR